jgi:pimeloyl-ACP methyl ester carboxylesterase
MGVTVPDSHELAARAAADGEIRLAVRHWTGGLRLRIGDTLTGFTLLDGEIEAGVPDAGSGDRPSGSGGVIALGGAAETWAPMLEEVPPRFANAVTVMVNRGLELDADPLLWWQYLPAVERAIELLRPAGSTSTRRAKPHEAGPLPRHDSPVGRYVHVDLDGADHRLYYEEAGRGIPLLLQHTAGAHGVQWRHLFEVPEITDHFRLIAYDLPYHGKSIPPVGRRWWERPYRLDGSFLRQVPVRLADALGLERPAFMGCSVGGLLALDLAFHHPDVFRAVISVEGALHVGGDLDALAGFWHPQVSNHTKAHLMEGLCSPTSPEPYVKEVSQVYAAGWPPAFLGDLHYYCVDFDLRERAGEIDTGRVAVHILNGEYDYSGTVEMGVEAHRAIPGSTHTEMRGVGHFPMQENPVEFVRHLLPMLEAIRGPAT